MHIIENESRGFFTGPGLDGPQARCVYLTAIQLIRIAGAHGSLRPMLEALFHRIVLLPAPANRTEPLRCVREIFKSPARLVDLSVILYLDRNQGQTCSDDMALFRLIIDAMEECAMAMTAGGNSGGGGNSSGTESSMKSSVECVAALLASLQAMCSGAIDETVMNDHTVEVLNARYAQLPEVDYSGPLTYQSMARLPPAYRDAVAELRNVEASSTGSDSDLEQNDECLSNGSGDTEGPEADEAISSDADSSRLDQATGAGTSWPYTCLEEPAKPRSDSDFDRHHAREFVKSLATNLVPRLLQLRSCVECDQAMQEFASTVCKENMANYSDSDYNLTAINADGIYLATCSALLLAWQLMKAGHYNDVTVAIPLSEQQFVTSVQNTGVLVYLSTFWLCELYQSIIVANPLLALREWTAADGRCPLVELLRDAGGFGRTQMLSDWQHLQSVCEPPTSDDTLHVARREAAKKLARRMLTCCWDSMVAILSAGLGDAGGRSAGHSAKDRLVALSQKTLKLKGRREIGDGEALFALSLDGLHAAATLSNALTLQHLAGKILQLLAGNICHTVGPRLTASQALSMDVVLSGGLELGSYSAECWAPVFAVCRHVTRLEHELFSLQQQASNGDEIPTTTTTTRGAAAYDGNANDKTTIAAGTGGNDKLNLTASPIEDDETWYDFCSLL